MSIKFHRKYALNMTLYVWSMVMHLQPMDEMPLPKITHPTVCDSGVNRPTLKSNRTSLWMNFEKMATAIGMTIDIDDRLLK